MRYVACDEAFRRGGAGEIFFGMNFNVFLNTNGREPKTEKSFF